MNWAFGINSKLPVFCLQDGERLVILYVCAHVAVMYDHTSNTQQLLQVRSRQAMNTAASAEGEIHILGVMQGPSDVQLD